ncbi:MAG: MFS transporter, partial [Polyangia bacterium]
ERAHDEERLSPPHVIRPQRDHDGTEEATHDEQATDEARGGGGDAVRRQELLEPRGEAIERAEAEGAIANGLGTMGMFLGMAAGMAATPALVESVGLRSTMIVFFVVAAVAAAVFVALGTERRPNVPSETGGFVSLLRRPKMLALFAIALLGLGSFNGLTTWLEQFLAPHGIDAATAGLVGGLLIVGGLFGAVVIPLWSDHVRRRKPFLVVCALIAAVCTVPVCTTGSVHALYGFALAMGFFFMPTFALLLDMCASEAGLARAGAATSLLMLFGNAGGVLVILAIPLLKAQTGADTLGIWSLAALLVVAAAIGVTIRETPARAEE